MEFYIFTIEQIKNEESHTEYGKVEKVSTEELALNKFYKKLSDVSAALGSTHTFMTIKIMNSLGGIIKEDKVGEYVTE